MAVTIPVTIPTTIPVTIPEVTHDRGNNGDNIEWISTSKFL